MKTFRYVFSDGHVLELEPTTSGKEILARYCLDNDVRLIYNGFQEFMGVGQRSTMGIIGGSNTRGDGFKTGFNPALGMEIKSPQHYKDVLKEKGMYEVGNEKQVSLGPKKKSMIDDEVIKEVVQMGGEISGNEASMLKGEIA